MGGVDSSAIEEVKARLNIADVVGRYLELRPAGNRFMGPCPFHHETKPSFSVSPDLGFYYCFGCQASGDVIDFFCRINGLEFREGLEQLAQEAGVELVSDPAARQRGRVRTRMLEMHSQAQAFFRKVLASGAGQGPRSYLEQRGMVPEVMDRFGIGYAPEGWQALHDYLKARGFDEKECVEAGLLSQNATTGRIYDRFRGRIIFPIHNVSGQVVAFGGRILADGEPKYLNSSESPIYRKGEHLFGLYQARQAVSAAKEAMLTEGYTDVIALHQHGFENSCGVLGTALTAEQINRLGGFCSRILLLFDGDRAGRQAAFRSTEMILSRGLECRVVDLPDGEDVDSVLKEGGRSALEGKLENSEDGLDFCLRMLSLDSPRDTIAWAKRFLGLIDEPALAGFYIPRIAEGMGVPEHELRLTLGRDTKRAQKKPVKAPVPENRVRTKGVSLRDREFLEFAVKFPEYLQELEQRGLKTALTTERARLFWEKLCRFGPDAVILRLDEAEKRFFIQSQMSEVRWDDPARQFEEYCEFLGKVSEKKTREDLLRQIQAAQESGDREMIRRLTARLNEFLSH